MTDVSRDHFRALGLASDASDADVVRAFRRLAKEHHPDRNPGDAGASERFRRVKLAYDALRATRDRPLPEGAHVVPDPLVTFREEFQRAEKSPPRPEDVDGRVAQLVDALDALDAQIVPTRDAVEAVHDAVRWCRLHVDLALAFKPFFAELRDASWARARFSGADEACVFLVELRQTLVHRRANTLDVTELRNLRARLDGARAVTAGWLEAMSA